MSDPFADFINEESSQPDTRSVASSPSSGDPFADFVSEAPAPGAVPGLQAQEASYDTSQPTDMSGAGTPEHPFQAIITYSQMLQKARKVGEAGFREAALGKELRAGTLTLEEVEQKIAADRELAEASGDIEEYEKQAWGSWITGIPASVSLGTAKALPMLEESTKVFIGGFAAGAGVTALGGVISPTALAAAPEVGKYTGSVAVAAWTADFIQGQEYLNLRRKGIPEEEAKRNSTFSAVVQGALSSVQFGHMAKVPLSSAKSYLAAQSQNIVKFMAEGVQFGGVQLALAEAQTATKLIFESLASTQSKVPGTEVTLEQAATEFWQTFKDTLTSSVGIFAGGKVVGKGAGMTGKAFLNVLKKTKDKHMENQAAKIPQPDGEATKPASQPEPAKPADQNQQQAPAEKSKNALEKERKAKLRLEKREAAEAEVRRIFDAAASLFRIESDETRLQETNRIQRLMKRMVSNSDLLDDKTKVRLLKRIVEIDGEAALLKTGEKFIEEQRGKEYANKVEAVEKKLKDAIASGQPKKGKAQIKPELQKTMQWYQEFFTEPKVKRKKGDPVREPGEEKRLAREAARDKAAAYVQDGFQAELTKLEESYKQLEKNELSELFNHPAELLEKRRIAMEALRYFSGSMKIGEVEKMAADISALVKGEKESFLDRKKKESERLLMQRDRVMEGVQGNKPVTPSHAPTEPRKMGLFGGMVNSLRRNSTALWDKLLQDTPADQREKIAREILDFTETENKEFELNQKASRKLIDLYEGAVGSWREAQRLIRDGAKSHLFEDSYTDSTGAPQTLGRYTMNELAYLHIAMQDEGAIPGLVHGNKFTLDGMVEAGQTSTQTAIRDILTQHEGGNYIKLAESVRDFYRWFAPSIGNHYLKEYGVELPMSENYSGKIFHLGTEVLKDSSVTDIINDAHAYAQKSIDPASIKLRNNSKLPVKAVDPFQQVQRHRGDMNFWIANSDKARELTFIFSDTKKNGLRQVIEHKLSPDFNSLIDSRLAFQFHLKPKLKDSGDRFWQATKNNLATGLLGARFDQFPKQLPTILGALSTCEPHEFIDGLRKATNKENLQEYLSNSGVYKERKDSLLPQILEATQERSYADAVTGDRALAIKEFGLIPMAKWGDGVASALIGFIEFNRIRSKGGSIAEAVAAGDGLVDRSQSSSRASQKVPAEFKGGLGNASLAFAKQNIQSINLEAGAIRDAVIHNDKYHVARAARTIAAIHVAQALFQGVNAIPAFMVGEDKDKERASVLIASGLIGGPFGSMPLFGYDLVEGALTGFRDTRTPRTIIGGLTGDVTKGLSRSVKLAGKAIEGEEITGEEWMKYFKSLAGLSSVITGLPFLGVFNTADFGGKVVKKVAEGGEE